MTAFYGGFDRAAHEEESLRTIAKGLELGINFLDTAWVYQVILNTHGSDLYKISFLRALVREAEETSPMRSWWAKRSKFTEEKILLWPPNLVYTLLQKGKPL